MARVPKNPEDLKKVISFGAKAAEVKAARARAAMNVDLNRAIPKAGPYTNYVDAQTLRDLTFKDPDEGVVATGDPDVFARVFRHFADDYDDMDKLDWDENLRNLMNGETYDSVPRFDAMWDPETGDIKVAIDWENIDQAEAMRVAAMSSGKNDGRIPFELNWSQEFGPPWNQNEDWKHSGRLVFVDEDGAVIHKSTWRDFDFPFDDDFKARRDPAKEGIFWAESPLSPWLFDTDESMKFQAATDGEVRGMLSSLYSPYFKQMYEELHGSLDWTQMKLGKSISDWVMDRMIPVPHRVHSRLRMGDGTELTKWLTGTGPVPFSADNLNEALRGTNIERLAPENQNRLLRDVADSRETQTRERAISNEERYERAREQGVDFSKEELGSKLWADTQDEVSHFNRVFDTMEREDPRRYAAIQEFIKDSPYRQDLMGMEGARADRPMLIFHSGKYLDMEKMGYSGVEAGQFLAPKEIGMHGGNLNQSAIFANAHQKVLPQIDEAGNIVRVYAPNTYGGPGTNLYEQIEQTSSWIDSQMPSRFKADYNRIRRSYAQQYLYSMVDDPSDVGKLKRPQIGEMIVEELKALDGWVDDPALEQAIMSVEASRYSQAGTVMYPLVFRGRRPFRMLDLVQNDVRNQAQSALKWQGWTPRQRANLELLTSRQLTHADATKAFRETLEEAGFDHIIYVNQNEEAGTPSVIFWDQSLVKPLYGSRGFDRNSDKWVNSVLASPLFGIGEQEGTDGGN